MLHYTRPISMLICADVLQEWVKEIGTIKNFLENLSAFDVSALCA